MIEAIKITFVGSGKYPDVTMVEPGFNVIPLRWGGGVEIVGREGRVQYLSDEADSNAVTDAGDQSHLITVERPQRVRSRGYRYFTTLETRVLKPGATLTLVPKGEIDRFKHDKRVFPSIILEAIPTARHEEIIHNE